jgi:hypothetical protein
MCRTESPGPGAAHPIKSQRRSYRICPTGCGAPHQIRMSGSLGEQVVVSDLLRFGTCGRMATSARNVIRRSPVNRWTDGTGERSDTGVEIWCRSDIVARGGRILYDEYSGISSRWAWSLTRRIHDKSRGRPSFHDSKNMNRLLRPARFARATCYM